MARDASDGGGHDGTPLTTGEYTVDVDELHQVANTVLGLADRIEAVGARGAMHEASTYGMPLAEAGHTWASRYGYLLAGIADDVEHAGYELRGTADAYYEVELSVVARAKGVRWDSAW